MKECILLVPNIIKKDIIKKIRKEYYNYNIKFMSLEDFIKKCTFTYDEKTIYYLMKEYNLNYSTALVYLKNLYYISDKLSNNKMHKLREIKDYLDSNKLLIYDNYFKESIKNKKIYIYGYSYLTKYQKSVLDSYDYEVKEIVSKENKISKIYYADYIEDEVLFVVNNICKLLKNNISINNIKIICSNEYEEVIKRIFNIYKIPISINNNSLYSIPIIKRLLANLNDDEVINNIKDIDIKNKIINILNKYTFVKDRNEVKELITNDFKNTLVKESSSGIKIVTINDFFNDDDYVFLMGFNKESIPFVYKDNDYFTDKEKEILSLDTSYELNILERDSTINKIKSINNLTITYKLYDTSNNYTKSDLFDIESIKIDNNDYSNSNMMNKILLTKKIDNLVKYSIKEEDIDVLSSNYSIPYMEYDNKYKNVNKEKLYKYLDNKLLLSYTALDNYNKCKFKYYLNSILKLNVISDDFKILLGDISHFVLSKMDEDNFDYEKVFDEYLKTKRNFNKKELFFLGKVKEELSFVINTIKKQLTYGTLDKKLYEKKVYINKDKSIKVTFMGVIDKILYKEEEGYTYLVIIDYKTGNADINLKNMDYGLNMQLPIYLYLTKNLNFNNPKIIGFYLQKILQTNYNNKNDYLEEKEKSLRLEGYSINDINMLSKFDNTYNDSKLIKGMKTTKDGFYAYTKVLTEEEMEEIINKTDRLIDKTIDEILEGDFSINPKVIDGNNVSCMFCEYKDICFRKEEDLIYINNKVGEEDE